MARQPSAGGPIHLKKVVMTTVALKIAIVLSLAASSAAATAQGSFLTLDGKAPLVIGHRGFPGLYPESTRPSYEAAADAYADVLEMDVHMSRDCVLVVRHNPWLSDNTNIAEVAEHKPAVAARKRTVPGVQVKVAYDNA